MGISSKRLKEIIVEEYNKLLEGWKRKKYKKSDYKKYNKLVKRGKAVLVQTSYGDEFAWEDGSSYGVFGSEEDGREIELVSLSSLLLFIGINNNNELLDMNKINA